MHRLIAILTTLVLSLFLLVPAVAAAEPWDWNGDEHLVVNTGGHLTLTADQSVDMLVIVSGSATIEGSPKSVVAVSSTVDFVGGQTTSVVAVNSTVTLDPASSVSGDVLRMNSSINAPSGTIQGGVQDLTSGLGGALFITSIVSAILYIGFAIALIVSALALSQLAGRQVREAAASFQREPVNVLVAAIVGVFALFSAGIIAIATVLGVPLGLGILLIVIPALFVVGYIVVGIAIGDALVARMSPTGGPRPALATFIGMLVVTLIGVVPFVGGLLAFAGFGAVSLRLYRAMRTSSRTTQSPVVRAPAPSAG
jgi:hypothetical protein